MATPLVLYETFLEARAKRLLEMLDDAVASKDWGEVEMVARQLSQHQATLQARESLARAGFN